LAVLVTGGTGFIGSYLVRELVNRGEEVVVFDIRANTELLDDITGKFSLVIGDLSEMNNLTSLLADFDIQYIHHLAALLTDVCEKHPIKCLKANALATINLLEFARHKRIKRFIYAGTGLPNIDENYDRNTLYEITKLFAELCGFWYWCKFAVDFRVLRICSAVFGPGRTRGGGGVYSLMIEKAAMGIPVKVSKKEHPWLVAPNEKIYWLYVKDLAKAFILLQDARQLHHRVYTITGWPASMQEVAEIVKEKIPGAKIEFESLEAKPNKPVKYDDRLIRAELGWKPSHTLEEEIWEHIRQVREQRNRESDQSIEW